MKRWVVFGLLLAALWSLTIGVSTLAVAQESAGAAALRRQELDGSFYRSAPPFPGLPVGRIEFVAAGFNETQRRLDEVDLATCHGRPHAFSGCLAKEQVRLRSAGGSLAE